MARWLQLCGRRAGQLAERAVEYRREDIDVSGDKEVRFGRIPLSLCVRARARARAPEQVVDDVWP